VRRSLHKVQDNTVALRFNSLTYHEAMPVPTTRHWL